MKDRARADPLGPTRRDTHGISHITRCTCALLHYFESVDASDGEREPGDSAGDVRGNLLAELRMLQ